MNRIKKAAYCLAYMPVLVAYAMLAAIRGIGLIVSSPMIALLYPDKVNIKLWD